ncbi:MAG TPA: gliding motility-associated C-terminal domain-containing protein, partial [Bacteroidia bacterium]
MADCKLQIPKTIAALAKNAAAVIFFFFPILWNGSEGIAFSQIIFFNSGIDISVTPNCTTYVDGHIINNPQGFIHNKGNIFLTGDWTNNEPSGCLDPTTGTVILYGGNEFIKGNQLTTFNNLDCAGNGTKTLNINTTAGGNTGVLSLNSNPFDLNSNRLFVTNPSSTAITRSSGYIISETPPASGYGTIQWNLGNSAGNYDFPFGTAAGAHIPFLFNISSAGTPSGTGNISVSTYPTATTNSPNNRPLPTGVADLIDHTTGKEAAPKCVDRFWIIDANNYSSNPTANITFTYQDAEWDLSGGSTNFILEDSLRAWRWNGTQWQNPPMGSDNSSANTVTANGVHTFSPWTLFTRETPPCGPLYIPNAFSPNGDSENDQWQPMCNCLKKVHLMVFNRWGEKVF